MTSAAAETEGARTVRFCLERTPTGGRPRICVGNDSLIEYDTLSRSQRFRARYLVRLTRSQDGGEWNGQENIQNEIQTQAEGPGFEAEEGRQGREEAHIYRIEGLKRTAGLERDQAVRGQPFAEAEGRGSCPISSRNMGPAKSTAWTTSWTSDISRPFSRNS